jgi:hypothetical protein
MTNLKFYYKEINRIKQIIIYNNKMFDDYGGPVVAPVEE